MRRAWWLVGLLLLLSCHGTAKPSTLPEVPRKASGVAAERTSTGLEVDAGRSSPVVRGGPVAYIKPSDPRATSEFSNVAIEGDTLAVGASGAAYVFKRTAGTWKQVARLTPSLTPEQAQNPHWLDGFGYQLAMSRNTIVAVGHGCAFAFVENDGVWRQEAFLEAPGTELGWNFRVAIDGDTAVFGAPQYGYQIVDTPGGPNLCGTGVAYVFVRKQGAWTREARLLASNAAANDRFGDSVAVSGDTIVVGAPGEDSTLSGKRSGPTDYDAAPNSGAAYVFVRNGHTWLQRALLKAPVAHDAPTESSCAGDGRGFGFDVAIAGDTLVISDPGEFDVSNTMPFAGTVYAFVRSGDVWNVQGVLTASNPGRVDRFGFSVAVSGDDIVVGAVGESSAGKGVNDARQNDDSAKWAGAAYWFVRRDGKWAQQAYLKASNTGAGDYFGQSVGVSGGRIAVGAGEEGSAASGVNPEHPGPEDDSRAGAGAVYVY